MGNISPQQIQDHIKTTPFAGYITEADLKKFCGWLKVAKFEAKSSIYNAGDKSKEFYIILSGEVEIRTPYPELEVITIKRKGEYFGFSGVVAGAHTLTATCSTEVLCLVLPERKKDKMLAGVKITTDPTKREIILGILGWEPHNFLKYNKFLRELTDVKKWGQLGCMWNCLAMKEGQKLFDEGSEGNALYLVVKGGCKAVTNAEHPNITAGGPDVKSAPVTAATLAAGTTPIGSGIEKGAELVLGEFKEHDVFGEISVFLNVPRTATVICNKPQTLILEIRRSEFMAFLKILPNVDQFETLMRQRTAEQFKKLQRTVPFYSAIPSAQFPELAKICKIEEVGPNRTIFKEGDAGAKFYIIIHGSVKVTCRADGADSKDKKGIHDARADVTLATLTPGRYFGEIALMRDCPRTATVTTVVRTVLLSINKAEFNTFFSAAPEALADFEVKLARYDVQLRSILYHPAGLKIFSDFCKSEFSEENLDFWRACRDFRHMAMQFEATKSVSPAEAKQLLTAKANQIVGNYISEDAKKQVNIISAIRNRLLASLKQGVVTAQLFSEAETQVLSLLGSDSFNRFKLGDHFPEMLKKLDCYTLGKESQIKKVEGKAHMRSASNVQQIKDFKLDAATLAQLQADAKDGDADPDTAAAAKPKKKSEMAKDSAQVKAGSLKKPGGAATATTTAAASATAADDDDDPNDFSMSKSSKKPTTATATASPAATASPPGSGSGVKKTSISTPAGAAAPPLLKKASSSATATPAAATAESEDDPNDFSCSKPSVKRIPSSTPAK